VRVTAVPVGRELRDEGVLVVAVVPVAAVPWRAGSCEQPASSRVPANVIVAIRQSGMVIVLSPGGCRGGVTHTRQFAL
jgi:hypothetical protein